VFHLSVFNSTLNFCIPCCIVRDFSPSFTCIIRNATEICCNIDRQCYPCMEFVRISLEVNFIDDFKEVKLVVHQDWKVSKISLRNNWKPRSLKFITEDGLKETIHVVVWKLNWTRKHKIQEVCALPWKLPFNASFVHKKKIYEYIYELYIQDFYH